MAHIVSLEFDYVINGEMELRTADNIYTVEKGDIFFINTGVMHDIRSKDRMSGCETYAHIFDIHFLSGTFNSIFEQKYILPVTKSKTLQAYIIHPDSYQRIQIMEKFLKIVELNQTEPFGYEFEIRSELSRLWCLFLNETEDIRSSSGEIDSIDFDRIKVMIEYIQGHYMDRIVLEDVALSANISNRECSRCFQRCIKTSPINYLNEYRIRMAAQMLLQTDDSIMSISENCGFSSSSYFGKTFFKMMQCTPKEYRKRQVV